MNRQINIALRDVGPIKEFELQMHSPGLWILFGSQGCGKTTTLRTVQQAVDGHTDIKPTKRDGTTAGEATVAGKTIRIMRQTREEGELSVEGLGDLDIYSLHSPGFNEAPTRDRHRIKALARLVGVKADPALFYGLCEGGQAQFESIVDRDALETDDLVEMAGRVKRGFEKAALAIEAQAERALSDMRAHMKIGEGLNTDAPHDEVELQQALGAAMGHRSALLQKRKSAVDILKAAADARAAMRESAPANAIEQAEADLAAAAEAMQATADKVLLLRAELAKVEGQLQVDKANQQAAQNALNSAKQNAANVEQWRASIAAAESIESPSDEDIAAATAAVNEASAAAAQGVKIREAVRARAEATKYSDEAKRHSEAGRRLRFSAADTQTVLSEAIANLDGCPLRVKFDDSGNPRLVIKTDRDEAEPFDRLSDGQRWMHILKIAAGANKLITLPQSAFGELSSNARRELHELAKEAGCYLLTAQVTDGPLRGEMYQDEPMQAAAAA